MALSTDATQVPLAISIDGIFETASSGLQELAQSTARLFAGLPAAATGFFDRSLQHSGILITGVVAGAAVVLLVMLVTKAMHHSATPVASGKAHKSPTSDPGTKDDLKSLPLAEVEKKLGSSPDGLSQAEAEKRLTQYGPNEIEEKKTNVLLKISQLFLGTHSLDDRSGGRAVGCGPALARFFHHPDACWFPMPRSGSWKSTRRATPSRP